MKIEALFTDYDGTIAPLGVRREASAVLPSTSRALAKLASKVPVAIITSKAYDFIQPRTGFASAWACCGGLEVDLADGSTVISPKLSDLSGLFNHARRTFRDGCILEEKESRAGRMIGFSVDWTGWSEPRGLNPFVLLARRRGFHVDRLPGYTFIDVYSGRPDKGRALVTLKKLLGVEGAVAYLGDSPLDNPAFRASDVAIGVAHGKPSPDLDCDFTIEFESLGRVLNGLAGGGLEWRPESLRESRVRA